MKIPMNQKSKIIEIPTVELFAIRNKEGKWFRRKGYNGRGDTWTDDFLKARIYNRISPARSIITFFSNTWPEYGIPDLVKISIDKVELIEETDRVNKAKEKKRLDEAKREERQKKEDVARAERELQRATQRLNDLKTK